MSMLQTVTRIDTRRISSVLLITGALLSTKHFVQGKGDVNGRPTALTCQNFASGKPPNCQCQEPWYSAHDEGCENTKCFHQYDRDGSWKWGDDYFYLPTLGADPFHDQYPEFSVCDCEPGWTGSGCAVALEDNLKCGKGMPYDQANKESVTGYLTTAPVSNTWCTVAPNAGFDAAIHSGLGSVSLFVQRTCKAGQDNNWTLGGGECSLVLYRQEPPNEALWGKVPLRDPWMFVKMQGCTRTVVVENFPAKLAKRDSPVVRLAVGLSKWALYAALMTLAIFGFNAPLMRRARKRYAIRVFLFACVCLIAFTVATYFSADYVVKEAYTATTATWQCTSTHCECATTWNSGHDATTPSCWNSWFNQNVLPHLTGSTTLACRGDKKMGEPDSCTFNFGPDNKVPVQPPDFLMSCQVSACGGTAEKLSDHTGEVAQTDSEKLRVQAAVGVSVAFALVFTVSLLHYLFVRRLLKQRTHEFNERFERRAPSAAEGGDEPTMNESILSDDGSGKGFTGEAMNTVLTLQNFSYFVMTATRRNETNDLFAKVNPFHEEKLPDKEEAKKELQRRMQEYRASSRSSLQPLNRSSASPQDSRIVSFASDEQTGRQIAVPAAAEVGSVPSEADVTTATPPNSNKKMKSGEKCILKNISLTVQSGEALAIMGPSGAGKTTLLDLLATHDKTGRLSGKMMLNGRNVMKRKWDYKRITGFVPQDDLLLAPLTVRQSVRHAARLKLPAPISDETVDTIVDETLESLNLTKCSDTPIGGSQGVRGVSGGERRRVAIAAELIAFPRVLMLDEPTSGLDSINAETVMRAIVNTAHRRRLKKGSGHMASRAAERYRSFFEYDPIVIFSIHQPSAEIFKMFDKLILLHSGHVTYFGPAQLAVPHMMSVLGAHREISNAVVLQRNPAEFILEMQHHTGDKGRARLRRHKYPQYTVVGEGEEGFDYTPPPIDENGGGETPYSRMMNNQSNGHDGSNGQGARTNGNGHHSNGNGSTDGAITTKPKDDDAAAADVYEMSEMRAKEREDDEEQEDTDDDELAPLLIHDGDDGNQLGPDVFAAARAARRYDAHVWMKMRILCQRTRDALLGNYYLISSHCVMAVALSLIFANLYPEQDLSLEGSLNKAGFFLFLLLVVALCSLSCLDLFISERRLFAQERENGYYSAIPYFVSKLIFDFLPLRVLPTATLTATIYSPIGLRHDSGSPFLWFVFNITMFSCFITAMILCIGMVVPTFGSGALLGGMVILWFSIFGGLFIQAQSIPPAFLIFRYSSPFYFAYEAMLTEELHGQLCTFQARESNGAYSGTPVPVECDQYLYQFGMYPRNFSRDVILLVSWLGFYLALATLLLAFVVKFKR